VTSYTLRLVAILYILLIPCLARSDILLAAPHITSLVEENGNGYYQRIMQQALGLVSHHVIEQTYPYKRALILFESKRVDCVYSFTSIAQEKFGTSAIAYSYPLGKFAYYMFSPKDTPPVINSSQLLGKRVGGAIGHDVYYRDTLTEGIELNLVDEDHRNVRLLELGRIDFMIGALPDLTPYLPRLSYSSAHPLVENFDRITCHRVAKTEAFLTELSKVLEALNHNGTYRRLAPDLYLPFK